MLKNIKLFSLLAIIVASTVVGLFGHSQTVLAQSSDTAAYMVRSDGTIDESTILFQTSRYIRVYGEDMGGGGESLDGFWTGSNPEEGDLYFKTENMVMYVSMETYRANGETVRAVIYFGEGQDPKNATSATWVQFVDHAFGVNYGGYSPSGEQTIAFSPTASPDEPTLPVTEEETEKEPKEEAPKSCQIKGIGWIICPVVNFLAEITDASYFLLDKTLLKLEPIALPGSGASDEKMQLYDSWKSMRDFANIIFIIGFLIIVFSQVTNIGVSNYGIKRLLPKIIIAAILVNVSYYICAIGIDISNILGNSLRGLLTPEGGALLKFEGEYDGVRFDSTGFTGITGVILGGGVTALIVYAFLPFFLPLVVSAALAVITVVIALTLRQALIVILVIISPLAFVALLLPNTEDYFKKWKSLFTAMLLVYPIISVVFGASALASNILMTSTNDFWMQIVGAGVAIIPLFITPIIMKVSGGLLNRWVGLVNDPTKGFFDNKRNALTERGKIISAERKQGSVQRTGNFVGSTRGGRLFGGANSRRRRAVSSLNGNYSALTRKDELQAAESGVESAYLGTGGGQESRNAAKNAQITLQNAQLDVETVRLQAGSVGFDLQHETMLREKRKQTNENEASAAAQTLMTGSAIDVGLKESEVRKHTAELNSQAASINAIPHALEEAEALAQTEKKSAEDNSAAVGLAAIAGTAAGQAALARGEDAKNTKLAAEKNASAAGLDGASEITAAAAESASLRAKASEDNLAADAAPHVSQAARTAAMVSEREKMAAQNTEMAAATNGPALTIAENAAKDAELAKKTADNNLSAGAQGSTNARTAAALSEIEKKTAEDNAATDTADSLNSNLAARDAMGRSKDAENQKTVAENDSKAIGIARADEEFKVQAEASSDALSALTNRDKQAYEEIAAQGPGAVSRGLGVSDATAAAARASRFESKAVDSAISTARTAGEEAYAEEILSPGSTYATTAGGNIDNARGQGRAKARAVSVQSTAANEAVNNAKTLLENDDPTKLIDRAQIALIEANNSGDVITARAAAQLLKGAGSKGGKVLTDTIEDIEIAGVQNGDVFANLRADLMGDKASNSALDKWATEGGDLTSKLSDVSTIERLNEQELASQQMHVLQDAEATGVLVKNIALVDRLLDQHSKGSIKLDTGKLELFNRVVTAARPPFGPPMPPPKPRSRTTVPLPYYGPPTP